MNDEAAPHDENAEAAVISAVLTAPTWLQRLQRIGLDSSHFYRPRHRSIWEAIVKLDDAGIPVDVVTVQARLAADGKLEEIGGDDVIEAIVGRAPSIANTLTYGEIVLEKAELRRYLRVGYALTEAARKHDFDAIKEAEGDLLNGGIRTKHTYSPADLGELAFAYLESDHETFKTPWPKFNKLIAGGFRRGSLTVISGYSSMGKSVVADQILEYAALHEGLKAHLWINEMTAQERTLRTLARLANVSLTSLLTDGALSIEEHGRVMDRMGKLPFGITDVAGWTAQEIARDVRAKKPDLACIDIFQKIAGGQQTHELDEKSRILNDIPKESQANCHVLLTAHVSKPSVRDGKPTPPNGSNLRGTGALENDADYVVFIHRETTDNGRRTDNGMLYTTKTRSGGQLGRVQVTLDGDHQKFTQTVAKRGQNAVDDDIPDF